MIKSIEIENFRCFHKTSAKGFGRVNLIGGKNNAGKTALLEALLLMGEPSNRSVIQLLSTRPIPLSFIKNVPEKTWDNFFFNQQKTNKILLKSTEVEDTFNVTEISYKESKDWKGNQSDDGELMDMTNVRVDELVQSTINLFARNFDKSGKTINVKAGNTSLIATNRGVKPDSSPQLRGYNPCFYIPANIKTSGLVLASEFDKAKFQGLNQTLLEAFQVIDKSISETSTLTIGGEPAIYLKRPNESYMPLTLFGDAMNKIADFILKIVNNKSSMILIDEIENGIHHENQRQIWKILFDLCNRFDVQLFATSHSAEMIEAFKDVVKANDFDGNYFRMAKHTVTGEIDIQKISIDVLEDKIENHQPIRGELTA
jgi:AAA15 family ATPase/GTPase